MAPERGVFGVGDTVPGAAGVSVVAVEPVVAVLAETAAVAMGRAMVEGVAERVFASETPMLPSANPATRAAAMAAMILALFMFFTPSGSLDAACSCAPCARSRDRVEGRGCFLHFPSDHQPGVEPPEPECDSDHEPLPLLLEPVSQPDELEDPEE